MDLGGRCIHDDAKTSFLSRVLKKHILLNARKAHPTGWDKSRTNASCMYTCKPRRLNSVRLCFNHHSVPECICDNSSIPYLHFAIPTFHWGFSENGAIRSSFQYPIQLGLKRNCVPAR